MKRGIDYFNPQLTLARDFCKSFPRVSGYKKDADDLAYFSAFAKIKDIPAIRKLLEASYDKEALEYIDDFFNGFNFEAQTD